MSNAKMFFTSFPLAYCGLFLLAGNRESFGKVRFAFPSTGQLIKKMRFFVPSKDSIVIILVPKNLRV